MFHACRVLEMAASINNSFKLSYNGLVFIIILPFFVFNGDFILVLDFCNVAFFSFFLKFCIKLILLLNQPSEPTNGIAV